MEIKQTIISSFQSMDEVEQVITFEKEHDWGYTICCKNLIDARDFSEFLLKLRLEEKVDYEIYPGPGDQYYDHFLYIKLKAN